MPKIKKSTLQKDHNKLLNQFAELVRNLKALDVIPREVCPTYIPKPNHLDQTIFEGHQDCWKYAAIDEDGDVNLFECLPHTTTYANEGIWVNDPGGFKLTGKSTPTDNWTGSLIKRKEKEVTGNGICTHLLSTNSRLVMCFVSDTSDEVAIQNGILAIINGNSRNGFTTQGIATWNFAVPVNNMGEPLTAKDVGL